MAYCWRPLFTLCSLLFSLSGCAGVYLSPAPQLPAMRKAGQVAVGASMRVFQPQLAGHLTAAASVSERIRLAGTFSKGFVRQREGLYGEALAGVEPSINSLLQYGILAGMGYGDVRAHHPHCPSNRGSDSFCFVPKGYVDDVSATYLRYAAQAHVVLHAPKIVHGGVGFRVSVMDMRFDEINERPAHSRGLPVALEPFVVGRVGNSRAQVEVQVRYTGIVNSPRFEGRKLVVPDQLTMAIGLRLVFGADDQATSLTRPQQ